MKAIPHRFALLICAALAMTALAACSDVHPLQTAAAAHEDNPSVK